MHAGLPVAPPHLDLPLAGPLRPGALLAIPLSSALTTSGIRYLPYLFPPRVAVAPVAVISTTSPVLVSVRHFAAAAAVAAAAAAAAGGRDPAVAVVGRAVSRAASTSRWPPPGGRGVARRAATGDGLRPA